MAEYIEFDFVSPERRLMSGEVAQVVVPGWEGEFAVLPGHAPVLSTMRPGVLSIVREVGGEAERYFVRGGFADVTPTSLTVLAQHAIAEVDLDRDQLKHAITNAQEDVDDAADDAARSRRQEALDHLKEIERAL
jgi:F-type H+-transporting ATPase subunit epsilon